MIKIYYDLYIKILNIDFMRRINFGLAIDRTAKQLTKMCILWHLYEQSAFVNAKAIPHSIEPAKVTENVSVSDHQVLQVIHCQHC